MTKTIKEIILPQKFSSNGVRLDTLTEHKVLMMLFTGAGFGLKNFIYATDVGRLKAEFASEPGKLSLEDAKKMGLNGRDSDILEAIKFLDLIILHELPPQETYPLKVSDTEQLNYNSEGQLVSRTTIEPTGEFSEIVYDPGDPEIILKKYIKKADGTLYYVEYNPLDPTKVQAEATTSPDGVKIKRVYSYDAKGKIKSYYESGPNYYKTTLVDEFGRIVFIQDVMGNMTKKTLNRYDDKAQTMTQTVEGDAKLLRQGVMTKKIVYALDGGQPTSTVISEIDTTIDGKIVQIL